MKLAAFAAAALLCFGAARADDAVSPERMELAREVMALNGSAAIFANYDRNLDTMVVQLRQSVPGLDDAAIADLKRIAVEEFNAFKPTLVEETARLYARHFSAEDLRALIAFYHTDAGRHMAAELPALTAESIQLNAPFTRRLMDRFRQYLMERAGQQHPRQNQSENP